MQLSIVPKLLSGQQLSEVIYDTIFEAQKYLLVISPYIQLDDYFKQEVFEKHKANSRLHLIIAFGKNQQDVKKSFKKEDIDYFKNFNNVTIVYIPTLHAKYYGNESQSIVTSMNLIDYSFLNNVELGVHSKKAIIPKSFFHRSEQTCQGLVENEGYVIYVKSPQYRKKFFFLKDYVGSKIELDVIDQLLSNGRVEKRSISEFTNWEVVNSTVKETRKTREEFGGVSIRKNIKEPIRKGYCIRCRSDIALDINRPLCDSCYSTWAFFENPYWEEKYCVSCGEGHNVNYAKPACRSCYMKIVRK